MEKEDVELAQITVHLAKAGANFDSVIDPESGLDERKSQSFTFEAGEASCKFIYFESLASRTNPLWLNFINEKLKAKSQIKFESRSRSPNGLLLIQLKGRILAATFGRGAGACLNKKAMEPDFGIKTAMNMCGNEEIRQTKSQSTAVTVTHIDRQVAKPSEAFVFGLSEAEDLKFISAQIKGNKNVTLQGRDSLTIKVIGENKLSWTKLIEQCATFLRRYGGKEYAALFPNYKNFRPANETETETLDKALLEAIKKKDFSRLQLCIPEFFSDSEYSYSYSNHQTRENRVYAYLDAAQLESHLNLGKIAIDNLKRKRIYAYSHDDDRILESVWWSVYDCLVYEHEIGKKYFVLSSGYWSQIDPDFYETIVNFVRDRVKEQACEAFCANIDISDDATKRNKESIFNERFVALRPTSILFDRAKLRIGLGRKDKEFCDILDFDEDGIVRIINAKQYKDASSINYLFSQAKLYSDAFLHDETFLAEIRGHISNSACATKDAYLNYISDVISDLRGEDYRICLWLLYNRKEKKPTKESIPLIAQYELKLMHDHLRKSCKYSDIILRFVPVQLKQYTTDVAAN